jgi:hypothetical protein
MKSEKLTCPPLILLDIVTCVLETEMLNDMHTNRERDIRDYVTVYSTFCVEAKG